MMMSDLPEDLLEEILCRVPAKSLNQLRSTCKQWNSLFNNERFTRKQFHIAAKQPLILMVNEFRVSSMSVNLHGNQSVEVADELSLIDPRSSNLDQFEITQVAHCDGLLLCSHEDHNRMVVWNPCTGQTRWIETKNGTGLYALGSYRDKKSDGNISYKVLSFNFLGFKDRQEIAIYEINSNSWRVLDVTCDCRPIYNQYGMSLNGNTYWFAYDEKEKKLGIFLLNFDYTTERFGPRLPLPYQCPSYKYAILSVVREEKLSVLLQRKDTSKTEIWVTNKIDETKVVSWSKVLTLDSPSPLRFRFTMNFLLDEEKKVVVCCNKYMINELEGKNLVHTVGEDNKFREDYFGLGECWPCLINYVPSLTQIRQSVARMQKRKR